MDKKDKEKVKVKKKGASLGNPGLQAKMHEISMPQEHMERLFDSSKKLGYESEEEKDIRLQKEAYNSQILRQIKKVALTPRQDQVMELMYKEGLTLSETARYLGVKPQSIRLVKNSAIKKIKKHINYDFIYEELPLLNKPYSD